MVTRRKAATSIFHTTYAFAYFCDPVARYVFQALHSTTRPANLKAIGFAGFAHPKMQAQVTLLDVSAAAANLLRLPMIAHADPDLGADADAIGLRSFQFQENPVAVFA